MAILPLYNGRDMIEKVIGQQHLVETPDFTCFLINATVGMKNYFFFTESWEESSNPHQQPQGCLQGQVQVLDLWGEGKVLRRG